MAFSWSSNEIITASDYNAAETALRSTSSCSSNNSPYSSYAATCPSYYSNNKCDGHWTTYYSDKNACNVYDSTYDGSYDGSHDGPDYSSDDSSGSPDNTCVYDSDWEVNCPNDEYEGDYGTYGNMGGCN